MLGCCWHLPSRCSLGLFVFMPNTFLYVKSISNNIFITEWLSCYGESIFASQAIPLQLFVCAVQRDIGFHFCRSIYSEINTESHGNNTCLIYCGQTYSRLTVRTGLSFFTSTRVTLNFVHRSIEIIRRRNELLIRFSSILFPGRSSYQVL